MLVFIMNLKNIFKKIVLIDLLLMILAVVFSTYPSEAVQFFNQNANPLSDMFITLAIIYIIALVICLYFLYKFKSIGKPFYFILFIIGIVLSLLAGSFAIDPIFYVIDGLSWANGGAILALLYFSPIKKEFEK